MEVSDVPPALRERLGGEATTGLLELFKTAHDECMTDVTATVVDRFERRLTEEANGLRAALTQSTEALRLEIAGLRTEMHDGDNALRLEMRDADNALRLEIRELGTSLRGEMRELGSSLRGEMTALAGSLRGEMTALASRAELADVASGLRAEIAALRRETLEGRFELLKWCFVFWVGQVFAVAGVVAVVVRLMRP
jgi:hypothetical protein